MSRKGGGDKMLSSKRGHLLTAISFALLFFAKQGDFARASPGPFPACLAVSGTQASEKEEVKLVVVVVVCFGQSLLCRLPCPLSVCFLPNYARALQTHLQLA